jgi:hypothetical protein
MVALAPELWAQAPSEFVLYRLAAAVLPSALQQAQELPIVFSFILLPVVNYRCLMTALYNLL